MTPRQSISSFILLLVSSALISSCGSGSIPELENTTAPPKPTNLPTVSVPTATPTPEEPEIPGSLYNKFLLGEAIGPVYSLEWSPDGHFLATTAYGRITLWDVKTLTELTTLNKHNHFVWGVAWGPDGNRFASASRDGKVRIWNASSYEELYFIKPGDAFCVDWSPDGQQLVTGTAEGRVAIWDAETGELVQEWRGKSLIISVAWSPDGSTIAAGLFDGKVRRWNPETGEELPTLIGTESRSDANGIAWSPDGTILASVHQDGKIRLWDVQNDSLINTFISHGNWVRGVAWSPDGQMLASAGHDALVKIWDVETGELLSKAIDTDNIMPFWSVSWSPDGKKIAVGSGEYDSVRDHGTINLWNVK